MDRIDHLENLFQKDTVDSMKCAPYDHLFGVRLQNKRIIRKIIRGHQTNYQSMVLKPHNHMTYTFINLNSHLNGDKEVVLRSRGRVVKSTVSF